MRSAHYRVFTEFFLFLGGGGRLRVGQSQPSFRKRVGPQKKIMKISFKKKDRGKSSASKEKNEKSNTRREQNETETKRSRSLSFFCRYSCFRSLFLSTSVFCFRVGFCLCFVFFRVPRAVTVKGVQTWRPASTDRHEFRHEGTRRNERNEEEEEEEEEEEKPKRKKKNLDAAPK